MIYIKKKYVSNSFLKTTEKCNAIDINVNILLHLKINLVYCASLFQVLAFANHALATASNALFRKEDNPLGHAPAATANKDQELLEALERLGTRIATPRIEMTPPLEVQSSPTSSEESLMIVDGEDYDEEADKWFKIYTMEEVSERDSENEAWVIINNRVYDFTQLLAKGTVRGKNIFLQTYLVLF